MPEALVLGCRFQAGPGLRTFWTAGRREFWTTEDPHRSHLITGVVLVCSHGLRYFRESNDDDDDDTDNDSWYDTSLLKDNATTISVMRNERISAMESDTKLSLHGI